MDPIPPTPQERIEIERLTRSLSEWALGDVKRAAEAGIPRLAFVGIAAWLDTMSRLYRGGTGKDAMKAFVEGYMPRYSGFHEELYDGLRNALLHEYSTRGYALTDGQPSKHWLPLGEAGTDRSINLEDLIRDCEDAFAALLANLERNADLRASVLPHTRKLLTEHKVGGLFPSDRLYPGKNVYPSAPFPASAAWDLAVTTSRKPPPSTPPA